MDILKPYASNQYTVKDSFSFVEDILTVKSAPYLCSFDIVSLFTNIPLDETMNICIDKVFQNRDKVDNLSRRQFKKLLLIAAKQNHFMFEDKFYDQLDGVGMGSPLGPVLANIFSFQFGK